MCMWIFFVYIMEGVTNIVHKRDMYNLDSHHFSIIVFLSSIFAREKKGYQEPDPNIFKEDYRWSDRLECFLKHKLRTAETNTNFGLANLFPNNNMGSKYLGW
ncbi:hypothetical protein ACJX0J_038359, partial [Zea mays]